MLKIELYADIICPWCIIGQHRLDKVLSERFPDLPVDIEHHPYELSPHAPPDGLRLDAYFRSKGVTDPAVAFARPEAEARASGLHLELSRATAIYRTVHAHTLLRRARQRGTQHALAWGLMNAYFHEGRNISDRNVLAGIAAGHGFEPEHARALLDSPEEQKLTEAQIAATRATGVVSVPTFRFGTMAMVGGQTEDQMARFIDQAAR